ncbi:MAG: T9SS type A sorting domain-containing protein, partial [Cytophagales bacterium]|nr:T9SS type A sorting domain-containing protein [Cytophagales bacterium]
RVPVRAINYCPLPIYFLDISAYSKGKTATIEWRMTKADKSSIHLIERSSDGQNFVQIGSISENVEENNTASHTFTDLNPAAGTNYYRIKVQSGEGVGYSKVVAVNLDKELSISVFPNPYSEKTFIRTFSKTNSTLSYTLLDVSGHILSTGEVSSNGELSIGENLIAGVYVLSIDTPTGKEFFRILKE